MIALPRTRGFSASKWQTFLKKHSNAALDEV